MFFSLCNTLFAHRPDGRLRSCISNIRNIYGAIEMYNMDNKEPITKLDDNGLKLLKKEGYLREITKPESKCEYKSMGNLSDRGIIYCVYHGDIEQLVSCEYYKYDQDKYKKIPQNIIDEEFNNNLDLVKREKSLYEEEIRKHNASKFFWHSMIFIIISLTVIIGFIDLCKIIINFISKLKINK